MISPKASLCCCSVPLSLSQETLSVLGTIGTPGVFGALSTASAPSARPRPRRPLDGPGILGNPRGFFLLRRKASNR